MSFDDIFPDNRADGKNALQQTQFVMLRMLKIVHYLCETHSIKYFLIGGSSLGAVRHKGFIPWDDDLDIAMTRDNYNRFVQLVVPELPNDIFFQSPQTEKSYPELDYVDARLRDKYSSYIHQDQESNPWHEGFQIDIFVYDKGFFPSKAPIIFQNILVNALVSTGAQRGKFLKFINALMPGNLVYASNWQKRLGMLKRKIGATYLTHNEITNLIKVPFEDAETYIPADYDAVLRRQFGDYMQLPPEDKRITDHNVKLEPFKPCKHTEILYWEERNKQ